MKKYFIFCLLVIFVFSIGCSSTKVLVDDSEIKPPVNYYYSSDKKEEVRKVIKKEEIKPPKDIIEDQYNILLAINKKIDSRIADIKSAIDGYKKISKTKKGDERKAIEKYRNELSRNSKELNKVKREINERINDIKIFFSMINVHVDYEKELIRKNDIIINKYKHLQ